MSSDHSFLIAASCAGVNFMIASFLMLSLRKLISNRSQSVSWWFIPKVAAICYFTTLVANTVRICIALEMQKGLRQIDQLNFNQMHRLEGVLVYFAFLLMLFLITETAHSKSLPVRVRQLCFPLSIYYVTTLLLPFLNGAFRYSRAFWEHSVFVLVVPLFVSLFVLALTWVVDISQRKMRLRS
jgi:exosortase/archaeosortase family protein